MNGDSYWANWKNGKGQGQGVYKWANGFRAPITFKTDESLKFGNRLIFPENDFRMEYRGPRSTQYGHNMPGRGTLFLKNEENEEERDSRGDGRRGGAPGCWKTSREEPATPPKK